MFQNKTIDENKLQRLVRLSNIRCKNDIAGHPFKDFIVEMFRRQIRVKSITDIREASGKVHKFTGIAKFTDAEVETIEFTRGILDQVTFDNIEMIYSVKIKPLFICDRQTQNAIDAGDLNIVVSDQVISATIRLCLMDITINKASKQELEIIVGNCQKLICRSFAVGTINAHLQLNRHSEYTQLIMA